jgi:regulator of protease activity HflC (stomatin/prohibitin superfamily)
MTEYVAVGVVLFLVLVAVFGSFFSAKTQTAYVIERFGKCVRIVRAGLNFKIPLIESAHKVNLATFQLQGKIDTKTKDNVFVSLPVAVQYSVGGTDEDIQNFYYKLTDLKQIESFLYNILLGHIPELDLDEIFISQQSISRKAMDELSVEMKPYGVQIAKVLITDIVPDKGVMEAMNRINAETRNKAANQAQGDAEYVLKVRQAEADAEVKRLAGVGVAKEREAIAEGWEQAIKRVKDATDLNDESTIFLLLFTNWTDMLRQVGGSNNSTMVFMPSGPEGMQAFQQTMTNALLAARAK